MPLLRPALRSVLRYAFATQCRSFRPHAMPLLCSSWPGIAFLRHCPAVLGPASLSLCASTRYVSMPLLCLLGGALLCRRAAGLSISVPWPCASLLGCSIAVLTKICDSMPPRRGSQCFALAAQIIVPPCRCYAVPCQAPRIHAIALQLLAGRGGAIAVQFAAYPLVAMPLHLLARRGGAVALRGSAGQSCALAIQSVAVQSRCCAAKRDSGPCHSGSVLDFLPGECSYAGCDSFVQ